MKFINYTNDGRVVVQHAALILSKLDETDTLELHTMDNAIILLKKDMTLVETRDVLQGMVRLARSMTLDALCNSDAEDKTPLVDESVDDEYEDNLGITQSSGLDHHAVYSRQRVDDFRENGVVSTQSARQHKDATDLVCQKAEAYAYLIRRLTPLECERLQGFPDGWTDIPDASDSARYKALGNSVAIPCVEFIMGRIAAALRAVSCWII